VARSGNIASFLPSPATHANPPQLRLRLLQIASDFGSAFLATLAKRKFGLFKPSGFWHFSGHHLA
jgi:hypothetical protein